MATKGKKSRAQDRTAPTGLRRFGDRLARSAVFRFFFREGSTPTHDHTRRRRQELIRLRVARRLMHWQKTPFHRLFSYLRGMFFMTELRAFSLLLLPFGLASVFRCLILPALTDDFPLLPGDGIAGAAILLLSLLLLSLRGPLYRAMADDGLLQRLLFNTLGLSRPYAADARAIPTLLLLLFGLGIGVASVFFSPLLITMILCAVAFLLLSLASPEFCLTLIGILFPFAPLLPHPQIVLAAAVALGLFSYFLKLLVGKRSFSFGPLDLFVLIFSLLFLLGGISSSYGNSTIESGITSAILIVGGYFLTANLLISRRTVLLFTRGVLFSAAVLAALGIYHSIVSLTSPSWQQGNAFLYLDRLCSTLIESNTVLVAFLLLLLPLLLSVILETGRAAWRYVPSMLFLLTALGLSQRIGAYIGIAAALILLLLLATRSHARWFLLLILVLPNVPILLSPAAHRAIASALSFLGEGFEATLLNRFAAQRASSLLLLEHFLGLGPALDGAPLASLLLPYGSSSTSTYNLLLEIGIEIGFQGILIFLLILLFAAKSALSSRLLERDNHMRLLTMGAASGLFSVLTLGAYSAIFESGRILFLFFLTLGLLRATRRVALEDEQARRLSKAPAESGTATAEIRISQAQKRR